MIRAIAVLAAILASAPSSTLVSSTAGAPLRPARATSLPFFWDNVSVFPDDLVNTNEAWSAIRAEMPDQSYRIAADDFELTERTEITRIVFYGVEVGSPNILGGDWYIFQGGGSGPPGALIASGSGVRMGHRDSGIVNTSFGTVYKNVLHPRNLVLPAGHYFLAFRTYQTVDYSGPKDNNTALTTRTRIGRSRAWWSFDVLGDGTVTGPWIPMDQFNLWPDNEWAFRIRGRTVPESRTHR